MATECKVPSPQNEVNFKSILDNIVKADGDLDSDESIDLSSEEDKE